jgi:arginase
LFICTQPSAQRVAASSLLGAPLYTLTKYEGMSEGPAALRIAGIGEAFEVAEDLGDITLPSLRKDTEEGSTKNLSHFYAATRLIYSAVKEVSSEMAFIIGGECSIAVGTLAGLSGVFEGRPGVLWMDAHGDFNTPGTSPSGYIGGMCLAMACGRGPRFQFEKEALTPPLAEERLVHLGSRALDRPEVRSFNASPAKLFTAQQVKNMGAAKVAGEVARHLASRSDWIFCHFDVDVVDPSLIPAVSYPTPGGLTLDESASIVRGLAMTRKLKVLELAAYNASLDYRGGSASMIVRLVKAITR